MVMMIILHYKYIKMDKEEKLIELINEHQKETNPDGIYLSVYTYRDGIFWHDSDCLTSVMAEDFLISKKYGFIEWLVENDKIDKENEELISLMSELWERENVEKCLLMLLAIQDEPIEFLCEILK